MNLPLTLNEIEEILHNRIKDDQFTTLKSIPRPDQLKDMDKATKRIVQAIENKETINLVGDYDVDGVVSTAIMVNFFQFLGIELNYIIPNRFEHGYGLSPLILDQISDGIIITVDNGISANEAAKICKERDLDLIITDHHTVGESLPDAFAIVNPKQADCSFPFKEICGAHVAWYLCASLKKALNVQYDLMNLFDLLTLAVVADIMPMVDLNRTVVKAGLRALENSNRPAISVIKKRFKLHSITEEDIGFKIAPLINCAGRMSDPLIALEFLLSYDKLEAGYQLDELIALNELRKRQQLEMFEDAKSEVNTDEDVIVVASETWNEGIIGIVASKLCDKYKKPSFVFSIEGDTAKASCRSTDNINLYELIKSCSSILNGFGGHKQAAGLSIQKDKIVEFKQLLLENIKNHKENSIDNQRTMGSLSFENVGYEVFEVIQKYRPYGNGNTFPRFLFEGLEVVGVQKIGKLKEYMKLTVSNQITTVEVLVFIDCQEVRIGETISFIAQIGKNSFRNEINYNLLLQEIID